MFESYGKGRNGYFNLDKTSVELETKMHEGEAVYVSFYSARSIWPGPAYAVLTLDDAEKLLHQLQRALAPAGIHPIKKWPAVR